MGLASLFPSCEDRINTLEIGKVTEIKSGETAENSQKGLSLRVGYINDSRCPEGAMCSWEGNASVEFHLTTKREKYDFTLDTHRPPNFKNDTVIEGVKYELIDVLPYPILGEGTPIKKVKILVGGK